MTDLLEKVHEASDLNKQIEAKIRQLRTENAQRAKYIEKNKARLEIENLAGSFALLYSAGQYDRLPDFFADTEQIYVQLSDVGIYEGRKNINRLFESLKERAVEGSFRIMNLTTPAIEISEDGKTAQGMWFNNGLAAIKDPTDLKAPAVDMWQNDKVAAEFIRTYDGWKILRLTICEEMRGLYHKSWGEYSIDPEYPDDDVYPQPTAPATRHRPFRADRPSCRNLITPVPYVHYEDLKDHF